MALISDSAQSQRRSREPPTAPTTQPAAPDQRGTDQVPFTVKILPTQEPKEKADKAEQDRQEKAEIDRKVAFETQRIADYTDRLAWFTLFLFGAAIVQAALFVWQLWLIRESLRDAKIAAEAVKVSADTGRKEFQATHRPKIRIKHIWLTSDIWAGERIIVNIVFGNSGASEARLNEAALHFHIIKNGRSLPPDPSMVPNITPVVAGRTLGSGYSFRINEATDGTVLTPDQNVGIQNGEAQLFCVGSINYLDSDDRVRTTNFCRVMVFPKNTTARSDNCRFVTVKDQDYEYED